MPIENAARPNPRSARPRPPLAVFSPFACLLVVVATGSAVVIFAAWPGIDLQVAAWFHQGGSFMGASRLARTVRQIFYWTPGVLLTGAVVLFLARRAGLPVPLAPNGRQVVFLLLSMALGPGLLVNVALKDHWHRPRPVQVEQFGGRMVFRPFYRFDGACQRNCSFVSGETSAAFWTLAPASLAPAPVRVEAVVAALVFGTATSLLRLAFGGHFLSDVIFGGLFTFLVLAVLHRLLLPAAKAADETAPRPGLPAGPGCL